ncbi:hypothetical protein GCM10011322_39930 [Salinarimonas ramus]|uniref:Amino acid adenylation domain-containing protein n=1 Tax=Salinarimonas ramus TaxID=690164 RepID=A0A917QG56_9HYPH|nr:hypothetical protein GCM10011322_39930 [Salinarimonas ramus]
MPGCPDRRAFWRRLVAGEECLTRFARDEMLADGVPARLLDDPAYVPVAGYLEDADRFDAAFFGTTPSEARRTDPQQRLLLECAYHALGDAGYAPATLPGVVGVYAGTGANAHFWRDLEYANDDPSEQFLSYVGNDKDFAATRIAYRLGLKGAAVAVQTACSTALVAVHLACQSLLLGETDMALAGASSLRLPRRAGYRYEPDGIESPDGHCRPFDANAAGTVFGDGVAMLALRRLDDALASGDRIHAVIRGSAVNNDGADKLGFTAPSESGQIGAVAEALAVAGCDPADVAFIETHGTGTALGDAVEVSALATVFAGARRAAPCPLGSVKANIGHTDTVAGAAGLIKAALALQNRLLPPQVNFAAPNPLLGLADRGFRVHDHALPLAPGAVAGVSSFGIGGSNVHMVLEAPPQRAARSARAVAGARIFPVAAASPEALAHRLDDLADMVARDAPDPDDLTFTLRRTEAGLRCRHVRIAGPDETPFAGGAPAPRIASPADKPARRVFLMPGQGAQYPGMGSGLYERFAGYREAIDEAAAILTPLLGEDVRRLMAAGTPEELAQTRLTQPLVFACDVACARLLQSVGVAPDMIIGHSLGEYAAACMAGVFSFADGLRLVARRGALMQALPTGRMVAVGADAETVARHLRGATAIAALNARESTVISGPPQDVSASVAALEAAGHACLPLATSHAFHSAMMEPMLDAFRAELARTALRPPRIPVVSNLTGGILSDADATSPDYWCRQLRAPVRFADGIGTLLAEGPAILLEAGPGRVLSSLARRHPAFAEAVGAHALLPPPQERRDEVAAVLEAAGAAWVSGAEVDWGALDDVSEPRVVDLPPYRFARERHWLDPAPARMRPMEEPRLPQILVPGWRRDPRRAPREGRLDGRWLVEASGNGADTAIAEALRALGAQAEVLPLDRIVADATSETAGIVLVGAGGDPLARVAASARAAETRGSAHPLAIAWQASGLFDVTGAERLDPNAALALGALRCLPLEHPNVTLAIADVDDPAAAAALLAHDLAAGAPAPLVAYRAGRRWLPVEEPLKEATEPPRIGGPILITGGHGGVGGLAARAVAALASEGGVDIYLLSRTGGAAPELPNARVHALVGDVGAEGTLRDTVSTILARHGRLAGVIHAAGSLDRSGFEPLAGAVAEAYARHAPAKIAGTTALVEALEGVAIDFCLLVSSLSTRLGGIAYGAYAAANAVLDQIAEAQARLGRPWLAADLDAFDLDPAANARDALTATTGDATFRRLIGAATHGHAGTLVVTANAYAPRRARWVAAASTAEISGDTPARLDEAAPAASPVDAAWCEVLGIEACADDENFFALGGSSLLALQVLARIRRTTGVEMGLADFLAAPTLAALREAAGTPATAQAEPAIRADRSAPLPILPGQRRIWVAEQMSPGRSNFAVNAAYAVEGPLDVAALGRALGALAARHEPLRTRFVVLDGVPHQIVDPAPAETRLDVVDAPEEVTGPRDAFFARPFDLAEGRLWRAMLLRHGPDRHTLLLAVHHIVVDDWSIGLLLDDLGRLYRAARTGAPQAEPAPVQFADICVARATRAELEADLAYWRRTLADLPDAPPLPSDAEADAAEDPHAGGVVAVEIAPRTLARLRTAAAAHGTTPYVWLLSAFQTALCGLGGARDIAVGTPLAGRTEPQSEEIVGYFVNPATLRLSLAEGETFAHLVARAGETVAAAHAHGGTPFESVLDALGRPAGATTFRAWMTLLTHAAPKNLDDDLRVTPIRLPDRPARIPLALVLEPEAEGLIGHLEFARATYRAQTAEALASAFSRILERSLAEPSSAVADMLSLCEDIRRDADQKNTEHFAETQRRRLASARRTTRSAARGIDR